MESANLDFGGLSLLPGLDLEIKLLTIDKRVPGYGLIDNKSAISLIPEWSDLQNGDL